MTAAVARELDYELVDWHEADGEWERFDLIVVRSVWDYTPPRDVVERAAPLLNSAEVLAWSSDKAYLYPAAPGTCSARASTWCPATTGRWCWSSSC